MSGAALVEWRGSCHCGAVVIGLAQSPSERLQCNCSLCRKTGWTGVYAQPGSVQISDESHALTAYEQGARTVTVWHCAHCGVTTHWTPLTAPPERMGINARLFDAQLWQALPVRYIDGASL